MFEDQVLDDVYIKAEYDVHDDVYIKAEYDVHDDVCIQDERIIFSLRFRFIV